MVFSNKTTLPQAAEEPNPSRNGGTAEVSVDSEVLGSPAFFFPSVPRSALLARHTIPVILAP